MRGFATNAYGDALRSLRTTRELALRRLAVDEESARRRETVRRARAIGALLFSNHEQQIYTTLTRLRQPVRGGKHRGGDSLGIRRTPSRQSIAAELRRK